ncbi:unnamed protein product [Mesocestoides corti]|nr:unnamed protein product [Mesocestoides corti]
MVKDVSKARRAKTGKQAFVAKSAGGHMTIRSLGKKPPPVSTIEYSKIKRLKRGSSTDRVVSLAYPGPNEKTPVAIYTMRFSSEEAYKNFTRSMEGRSSTPDLARSSPNYSEPPPHSTTSRDPGLESQHQQQEKPKQKKSKKKSRHHSLTSSSSSSSSNRASSTGSGRRSRAVVAFISTDCLRPKSRPPDRSLSPIITINTPIETSYVVATSRIRKSPSTTSRYRGSSARPASRCPDQKFTIIKPTVRTHRRRSVSSSSASSTQSYSTLTESSYSSSSSSGRSSYSSSRSSLDSFTELRSRVTLEERSSPVKFRRVPVRNHNIVNLSSSSSSSSDEASSGEVLHGGRTFVISRCSGDRGSRARCRPVAGVTVTKDTPSFVFRAENL